MTIPDVRHSPTGVDDLQVDDERDREKVLAWIRSLPPSERARVVRTMGEARMRQAIAAEGDKAIYELTRNSTWAEVARDLGMTTRMVNRAVTRHYAAQKRAGEGSA